MSTLGYTDQRGRLERLLRNALEGCLIDSIIEEEGQRLVINAHRVEGHRVGVRFLATHHWEATADPAPNSAIRVGKVSTGIGGGKALLRIFVPWGTSTMASGSRVRIDVGGARLTIDCEDAEWWQDETVIGREGEPS